MIVISVFSQQESRVKRTHWRGASCTASRCAVTPAKCQPEQQNLEDMVASSEGKGGGIKQNVVEERGMRFLLSCSCLEGTVKYLKLTQDQLEPVSTTALRAIRRLLKLETVTNYSTCYGTSVHSCYHVLASPWQNLSQGSFPVSYWGGERLERGSRPELA